MTMARHLVIFARYPVAGLGKRRMAIDTGPVQAVRFQRVRIALLISRLARDPRWTTWLAVTPDRSGPWPSHVRRVGQGHGELGQRLTRVFTTLPRGRLVVIGTDIPEVGPCDIARAFRLLGGHDAVFGPADDGGYWLIGLKRAPRSRLPFSNVRWSTVDALSDTERNLAGASVARVRQLEDVDDAATLKRHPEWNRRLMAFSSNHEAP